MEKPLTEEDVQRVAALVVSLQEALEDAGHVDLWTQLVEIQDWMASAVTKSGSLEDALALQVSETIVSQLTEIHSQLIALTKEPSNSVQFFYLCKHLGDALPELGIRQEHPFEQEYQLLVHNCWLSDVSLPAYRFGDATRMTLQGPEICLHNVFMEIKLDGRKCTLPQQRVTEKRCATWSNERMLFSCCQQSHLKLPVRDYRQIQSSLVGHPLIGLAKLTLDELKIGEPAQKKLVITRNGKKQLVPLAPTALQAALPTALVAVQAP